MSSVGAGGPSSSSNQGRFFIRLKPRSERKLSADQVIRELQPQARRGRRASASYLAEPAHHQRRRPPVEEPVPVHAAGHGHDELYKASDALVQRMAQDCPLLTDVTTRPADQEPEVDVSIDRDRAAALGVTRRADQQALYDAYGSRQVSTIYTPSDQYWVILELQPAFQTRRQRARAACTCTGPTATWCRSRAVATMSPGYGPLSVNHQGQTAGRHAVVQPASRGASLGDAVDAVQTRGARDRCRSTVTTNFAGTAQAFQAASRACCAAAARRPRDLPRARHPVRELHPPAHDPLGPAVRRVRRAAHAAGCSASSSRSTRSSASSC